MSEAIQLVRTYFIQGPVPKGRFEVPRYAISDPPSGGYHSVFVLPQEKRSTVFDPVSFWSETVPNGCAELKYATMVEMTPAKRDQMITMITQQWASWAKFGHQVDYDMATVVLKLLDPEAVIPLNSIRAAIDPLTGEVKSRGGKALNVEALRAIRPDSKRGLIAKFFIASEPQSLREAMAKFGMTRGGVLSHLFCINRDNGLPYRLAGDCAIIDVPEGWDPFVVSPAPEAPRRNSMDPDEMLEDEPAEPRVVSGPKGKPTDLSRLIPIRADSKRGALAKHFLVEGFASIADYCTSASLSRSAVLSHLYTIWKDNGIGHAVSSDGLGAKLLVPKDFNPLNTGPKPKRGSSNQETQPEVISLEDESWLN